MVNPVGWDESAQRVHDVGHQPDGALMHYSTCWCRGRTDDAAVEMVLRKHLPVPVPGDTTDVLCMCDVTQTYEGPVGHRLHVAAELRKAGMLRVNGGSIPISTEATGSNANSGQSSSAVSES